MTPKPDFQRISFLLNGPNNPRRFPLVQRSCTDQNPELLLIVDGGLDRVDGAAIKANRTIWIGDGDSASFESKQRFAQLCESEASRFETKSLPTKKDLSDFAASLDVLTQYSPKETPLLIDVHFGLGGSRGHEEANLREAERFLLSRMAPTILLFHPTLLLTNTPVQLALGRGREFSLFPLRGTTCTEVTILGAEYEGEVTLLRPSHGLNNRTTTETLSIAPEPANRLMLVLEDPSTVSP